MPFLNLFRRKTLDQLVGETIAPQNQLKRALGPVHLTLLGVGAIIGAGIFSTVGTAAAGGSEHIGAGPALVLSFVLVAVACGFAALCYSEFAAMVPVSGSAYTYAYATLGELIAWIIGWDLILEYAVGNVAVAISWSDYFQSLLAGFKIQWPLWLGTDLRSALQAAHKVAEAKAAGVDLNTLGDVVLRGNNALAAAPRLLGLPVVFNLPAVLIVALITWILVRGIRESASFNSAMVLLKLAIIGFFIAVGACYVKPENWTPFAPHGFAGISSAAAIIFFAYIGFDAVSTAAEETRNPQRDMPIGIIASLIVCTIVYVAVALVLTGMVKWDQFSGVADPLAKAFSDRGMNWTAGIISFGAVFATTSVLLVFQLGQSRIFFSMGRDRLLPPWSAKVHPKFRTPHVTTILTGIFVAGFAAVTNINEVVELCNIGTLFAFAIVSIGVLVLRFVQCDLPRPFITPVAWFIAPMGAALSIYLMIQLPTVTWLRFVLWLVVGLVIYFTYGIRKSRLVHQSCQLVELLRPAGRVNEGTTLHVLYSFKGRITRADYWLKGVLPLLLVSVLATIILVLEARSGRAPVLYYIIVALYLWPQCAVVIKRLHDLNISAGWLLTMLIPVVNIIAGVLLSVAMGFRKGTQGPNRFGPDPLQRQHSHPKSMEV